jgi:hypothetical protein
LIRNCLRMICSQLWQAFFSRKPKKTENQKMLCPFSFAVASVKNNCTINYMPPGRACQLAWRDSLYKNKKR